MLSALGSGLGISVKSGNIHGSLKGGSELPSAPTFSPPAFCCFHHNCKFWEQKKRHRPPLPTVASAGKDPLIGLAFPEISISRPHAHAEQVYQLGPSLQKNGTHGAAASSFGQSPPPPSSFPEGFVVHALKNSLETHSHRRRLPATHSAAAERTREFRTAPTSPVKCRRTNFLQRGRRSNYRLV